MQATPSFAPDRSGDYAFISYSHADALAGFQYLEPLAAEGFRFWFDGGLTPTEPWNNELADAIAGCTLFVLFVSPISMERVEVTKEVRFARSQGKPILAVHLRSTALPPQLEFELGELQGILAHQQTVEAVVGGIRKQLFSHGVSKGEPAPSAEHPPTRRRDRSGMPAKQTGKRAVPITEAFADRVPESEALRRSVERIRLVLNERVPFENGVFPNVLVFHGGGGVGKSGLSKHLESWVSGELSSEHHWGPWTGGAVLPIRWDFNDSEGDIQFAGLMRTLRHALRVVPEQLLAFDLGLAAYLEAVGADNAGLGLSGPAAQGVLASLQTIAARLRMGVPQELDLGTVRQVVSRAQSACPADLFEDYVLGDFLDACERVPQGSQAPGLAADLIYLLVQELYYLPVEDRPLPVFFIDHFERVQRRFGHSHEPDVAHIVSQMPFGLFVITGRDRLDWADERRTDLEHAGPAAWPGLVDATTPDPRQHLLGRLSDQDTRRLYERHREVNRWNMPEEVLCQLVERSSGLPVYISAVLQLAQTLTRHDPDRAFTTEDLDGDLPEVVTRLVNVLDDEERTAFRAACVLPFFDVGLAAVVGQVSSGAVERAMRFALVEENRDSSYPHRVHDVIRNLVKIDRRSQGYWGDGDWNAAARRGLVEAKRRIAEARAARNERAEIEAIVLGIRLAHEWKLTGAGLEDAVRDGPSIRVLESHLPKVTVADSSMTESEALISFVHAVSLPQRRGLEQLEILSRIGQPASTRASLFLAYRQRTQGRSGDALATLTQIVARDPTMAEYARFQYAVTLRMVRRFRDAVAYADEHLPESPRQSRFAVICQRMHGVFDADTPGSRASARVLQASTRVRLESEASDLLADARTEGVPFWRAAEMYDHAVRRRQTGDMRTALHVLGYLTLADEAKFSQIHQKLTRSIDDEESTASTVPAVLALRALLTRDSRDAAAARASVTEAGEVKSARISVEVWLEELGFPLEVPPTQWLIPYEQVRENWLTVARRVVERAKAAPPLTAEMQEWWDARF